VTTIRRMGPRDELAVSLLLCECYRWLAAVERYSPQQLDFLIAERGSLKTVQVESRGQLYLVACRDETIIGMVAVAENVITKLYVASEHHRQGIGTALFDAAEASVRDAGSDQMTLGTTPSAVAFYERRGMRVMGHRLHHAGVFCGRETVLMEKTLRAQA
jgi:ribosomal protein S18 acetylase RimI-like enzyme